MTAEQRCAPIRVVLADDEVLVRAGLRIVLEADGSIRVVGEAEDGGALLVAVDAHRPDVVLVDVQMPGVDGLAALRLLCARPDAPPAAVLTTFDLDEYVAEALRIGVQGFLLKDAEPEALVRAVHDLAAGGAVLDPRITARLLPRFAADSPALPVTRPAGLTLRERQVLRGLASGDSNAAIGNRLGLAEATVKKYVSALLVKFGAGTGCRLHCWRRAGGADDQRPLEAACAAAPGGARGRRGRAAGRWRCCWDSPRSCGPCPRHCLRARCCRCGTRLAAAGPARRVVGLVGGLGWPPAIVALYALGRRGGRVWATVPWLVLPLLAAVVPVLLTQDPPRPDAVLLVAFVAINAGAPAAMGLLMSTRERFTSRLRELERARESASTAVQEAARAQERARIGREIHDAVGHHATLIAVGAAALAVSTAEEETRRAAERFRVLAKSALAEMRSALGLLDPGGERLGGLAEMAALVAGAQAAGVEIEIEIEQSGAPAELAPGVGRAVYRVVQESLTNATRHAPGAPVRVELCWRPDELYVLRAQPRGAAVRAAPSRGVQRGWRRPDGPRGAGHLGGRPTLRRAGPGWRLRGAGGIPAGRRAGSGARRASPRRSIAHSRSHSPSIAPLPAGTHESRLDGATNGGGAPRTRDRD